MRGLGGKLASGGVYGIVLLALLWSLSGCGKGDSSSDPSTIGFKSPGIRANGFLSPGVHCGWGALWLPLEWDKVPSGTRELALFIGRFRYVRAGDHAKPVVTYADLVYRLDPSTHRNAANVLPENAQWSKVGRKSCPSPWGDQKIAQALFALDRTRVRHLTREEATRLTEEALQAERTSEPISGPPGPLREDTAGVGSFVVGYAPGYAPGNAPGNGP